MYKIKKLSLILIFLFSFSYISYTLRELSCSLECSKYKDLILKTSTDFVELKKALKADKYQKYPDLVKRFDMAKFLSLDFPLEIFLNSLSLFSKDDQSYLAKQYMIKHNVNLNLDFDDIDFKLMKGVFLEHNYLKNLVLDSHFYFVSLDTLRFLIRNEKKIEVWNELQNKGFVDAIDLNLIQIEQENIDNILYLVDNGILFKKDIKYDFKSISLDNLASLIQRDFMVEDAHLLFHRQDENLDIFLSRIIPYIEFDESTNPLLICMKKNFKVCTEVSLSNKYILQDNGMNENPLVLALRNQDKELINKMLEKVRNTKIQKFDYRVIARTYLKDDILIEKIERTFHD